MRPTFERCEARALCAGALIPPTVDTVPVDTSMPVLDWGGNCDCPTVTLGPVIPAVPSGNPYVVTNPAPNPVPRTSFSGWYEAVYDEVAGTLGNWFYGNGPPTAPAPTAPRPPATPQPPALPYPYIPGPSSGLDEPSDGTLEGLA